MKPRSRELAQARYALLFLAAASVYAALLSSGGVLQIAFSANALLMTTVAFGVFARQPAALLRVPARSPARKRR